MTRVYRVVTTPELLPDDRNFGAQIARRDGQVVLLVPQPLLPLLVERRIERSDLFYALVLTDPRAVAKQLGWSLGQVVKSLKGLQGMLYPKETPKPRKAG